jgi:hypothetical protein
MTTRIYFTVIYQLFISKISALFRFFHSVKSLIFQGFSEATADADDQSERGAEGVQAVRRRSSTLSTRPGDFRAGTQANASVQSRLP